MLSAMRAARLSVSASLQPSTVSKPSSRAARMMRTAISPRFAINTFLIVRVISDTSRIDHDEHSVSVDGIAIGDRETAHHTRYACKYLVELLHQLHNSDNRFGRDALPFLNERRLAGCGAAIKRPRDFAFDFEVGHLVVALGL